MRIRSFGLAVVLLGVFVLMLLTSYEVNRHVSAFAAAAVSICGLAIQMYGIYKMEPTPKDESIVAREKRAALIRRLKSLPHQEKINLLMRGNI